MTEFLETLDILRETFFNAEIIAKSWLFLLKGLGMTIVVALIVIPLGLIAGLGIATLATLRKKVLGIPLNWFLIAYVDFFRAFPPLVLLMFVHFGLPFAGIDFPAIVSVAIAFTLNTSSYYGEVFRAGLESVPRGQAEAARSTGLTRFQTLAYVVVPQAVRNVLPDLLGNTLEVVKLTSLASVVAVTELTYNARGAQALLFNPTPIVLAALMYLALLWPLVRLLSRLEHKAISVR
jgi:polar amino acid transport system permease protein